MGGRNLSEMGLPEYTFQSPAQAASPTDNTQPDNTIFPERRDISFLIPLISNLLFPQGIKDSFRYKAALHLELEGVELGVSHLEFQSHGFTLQSL